MNDAPYTQQAVEEARALLWGDIRCCLDSPDTAITDFIWQAIDAFEAAVRADECRRVYEAAYDADLPERR